MATDVGSSLDIGQLLSGSVWLALVVILLVLILPSIQTIGPTQVGLLTKRFSFKKLKDGNAIAFKGEAGYQEGLLMPGWRFVFWPLYICTKYPWVQVPVGQVGVVISQVGETLPVGAKSAAYKEVFGDFRSLRTFIENGGQKGVQRPVLPPGATVPMHPIAFLVITQNQVYGHPMQPELEAAYRRRTLSCSDFGLDPSQLNVVRIEPTLTDSGLIQDMVGIVTTLEGPPLDEGDIACRLGGYADLVALERTQRFPTLRSSSVCSAARTTCTGPTRTSRRSWTRAARWACSTTRCCTERTRSTRSW
jgi:hypothetical protein